MSQKVRIFANDFKPLGRLKKTKQGSIAQSVQSICLTSRGSLVRIQLLPQAKQQEGPSAVFLYIQGLQQLHNKKKIINNVKKLQQFGPCVS